MVTATGAKAEGEGRRAGGGGGGGGLRATGRAGAMRAPLEPWPLSALKENSRFPGRVAAPEGTLRIVSPVCTGMVVLSTTILQPPMDASAMRRAAASKLLGIARARIRMQVGSCRICSNRNFCFHLSYLDKSAAWPVPTPLVLRGVLMQTKTAWLGATVS